MSAPVAPPSLAERLGFAASDRIAVVHADDIGMCHAANEGAFDALEHGVVTCGSIMVPCPWFPEAAARARANPGAYDLGVHLTLNAEWSRYRWGPVAGRRAVPSLVDAEGYLPRTSLEVAKRAKPAEVETELRAQIEMALSAGIDVTHLDAHMGTAFFPPFLESYAKLAQEFRIPALAVTPDPPALARAGLAGAADMIRRVVELLSAAGLPILDALDSNSLGFPAGGGEAHAQSRLAGLGAGVTYFILHPARDGEELRAITPDHHARAFEHQFYGSARGRAALAEAGICTVGMRALRDLLA
ncbi:polysaccharide deacetylase family protein [Myxococcota bacterium]|nr:polysaccharide deacetylase family protein [Myxococcota bacterium]MCZ7617174.1 polysaccharide deacetylase family protein [Myxococcota bacterium]